MSNHIHRYSSIQDVFYGSSDVINLENLSLPTTNRLVAVIGGMSAVNHIVKSQAKDIIFYDINYYSIVYCKLIIKLILDSKDADDLFLKMAQSDYEVNTKEESYMRDVLVFLGKSSPFPKGPRWTSDIPNNGNVYLKEPKNRGIQLGHPKRSWKYALDNFDKLKKVLYDASISYQLIDVYSQDFNLLINHPSTWVHFSNIFQVSFSNNWRCSHSFVFNHPKIILLDETLPPLCLNHSGNLEVVREKKRWSVNACFL